jgi:hypothetical protein
MAMENLIYNYWGFLINQTRQNGFTVLSLQINMWRFSKCIVNVTNGDTPWLRWVSAATRWAVLRTVWRLIFQLLNSYSSCTDIKYYYSRFARRRGALRLNNIFPYKRNCQVGFLCRYIVHESVSNRSTYLGLEWDVSVLNGCCGINLSFCVK